MYGANIPRFVLCHRSKLHSPHRNICQYLSSVQYELPCLHLPQMSDRTHSCLLNSYRQAVYAKYHTPHAVLLPHKKQSTGAMNGSSVYSLYNHPEVALRSSWCLWLALYIFPEPELPRCCRQTFAIQNRPDKESDFWKSSHCIYPVRKIAVLRQ